MKSTLVSKIILILNLLKCSTPTHIVVWDACGTLSTRISMWPLIETLANKGHNLTYISAFKVPESSSHRKIRIILPKKLSAVFETSPEEHMNRFKIRKTAFGIPRHWYDNRNLGLSGCEALYADEQFLSWATYAKVDLVIVEMSVNECAYGFVHLWKSKLIIYSTTTAMTWFHDAHGLPDESSSISDNLFAYPTSVKNQMSFWQRFLNTMNPILYTLTREWFYLPKMEELTKKGLGFKEMPSFKEIEKNTSLIFLTTHFSFETPRSLPPNFVPIGGAVVKRKIKPLKDEVAKFVDSAKDGFVYISFGTIITQEFTHLDPQLQVEFINALKAFPEMKFVWKSGKPINATTLPKNVLLAKFAPQQSLLSHPKIKAFITHAGMGSTAEAIHFSVPLICIPIVMDQDFNANAIVERGAGIKLEILTLKTSELKHAISKILHDQRYRNSMAKLTKIFKDRPRPPLEEAVWWVEYILRHKNIHELLTPPSAHQPWWKRRLLDVWIFTFLIIVLVIITLLFLISRVACVIILLVCPRYLPRRYRRNSRVIVRRALLRLSNVVHKTMGKLRSRS